MTKINNDLINARVGDWLALRGHDGKPMTDEGRVRVCRVEWDANEEAIRIIIRREDGEPNHMGHVYISINRHSVDVATGQVYMESWSGMSNYMLAERPSHADRG